MESESKYWDQLTVDYMMEESDDERSDELIVHELPWAVYKYEIDIFIMCIFNTCIELNEFLQRFNKRY